MTTTLVAAENFASDLVADLSLDLFDAFASTEKTLCANMGGHTGIPQFAGEDAARFFARHLGSDAD